MRFRMLRPRVLVWFSLAAISLLSEGRTGAAFPAERSTDQAVDFNRDIRPILSDNCFACHGPDASKRKSKLRFDSEEGAFIDLGGYRAIVPGRVEESEIYRRITAELDAERMPPVSSGRILTPQQIELIGRWIGQGAKWQKHWSFIPPHRPELPKVANLHWPRKPIDYFVLDRLAREALSPSPEADRTTLIRRVTLDLTGLPPTATEVDAFLADTSANAYERVVDHLLASPRYGERMAVPWLEASRYADTNGYQSDGERHMWRWRDWVIEAFNKNIPFDRFTIEQLAGDMLPNTTLDQKIATGFNRNHRINAEGGIIPEEYAVEYVADRVDTTSTVWLGLTVGCARCHDHKYDPITQREYYQVFAYFNNIPERGKGVKFGNSAPFIKAPAPEQQAQLTEIESRLARAEREFNELLPEIETKQAQWEATCHRDTENTEQAIEDWSIKDGLLASYDLEGEFDGNRSVEVGDAGNFGYFDKFTLASWIAPKGGRTGAILSRMNNDHSESPGYSLYLEGGKVQLNLSKRWLDDALRVETEEALPPDRWTHVAASYDGSRVAEGIKIYINGRAVPLRIIVDELNQNFKSKEPLRIGSLRTAEGRFHGDIDDVRIYSRTLTSDEVEIVSTPQSIAEIIAIAPEKRTASQSKKIRAYFLEAAGPEPIREAYRRTGTLRRERDSFVETIPTVMVMEEMENPRSTFLLIRGAYDKPGEKITSAVPSSLPSLPEPASNNRLAFAQWLVHPSNPLTARVAVNRFWQMYFGAGLVKTVEDFGLQGESPSHPELLDWLATEFIRSGWDVKALQKLIVTSATYRQSSKLRPELAQRDPENRWLGRGPRLRLSAEMIRDQALAVSGLLVEKIGGPSVRPYQPSGLWSELTGDDYKPDTGKNLYRRSLYTFWKRTIPPPTMATFDAPSRETCTVRQTRTNTPLQALSLLNEVTFVEAARALAQRMLAEGGKTLEERITLAFRLATARAPKAIELEILKRSFEGYRSHYDKDRKAAAELTRFGDSKPDEKFDLAELAANTAIANTILNLDETVAKE